MASPSHEARRQAMQALGMRYAEQFSENYGEQMEVIVFSAALAAWCDLGHDCSNQNLGLLWLCVSTGECAFKGLTDFWTRGFSAGELQAHQSLREKFLNAARGGDVGFLGIGARSESEPSE